MPGKQYSGLHLTFNELTTNEAANILEYVFLLIREIQTWHYMYLEK